MQRRSIKMYRITEKVEDLVAYDTVKGAFDSMAKRADRQLKPLADDIYNGLRMGQRVSRRAPVVADYRFQAKDKARTMTEGISEFKKRFPKYGEKLQAIIDETRKTKKRYLVFGVKDGREIPEEIYLGVLESIGIPKEGLKKTLDTVMGITEVLEENREKGLEEMLIK